MTRVTTLDRVQSTFPRILCSFMFGACLALSFLQSACQSTGVQGAGKGIESPFAWVVAKGEKSHLFMGTIHAGVTLDELPRSLRTDFDDHEVFISELGDTLLLSPSRMNEAFDHATQSVLTKMMSQTRRLPPSPRSLLTPDEQRAFQDLVAPGGEHLITRGPLWLACLVAMQASLRDAGFEGSPSLDTELTQAAKQSGLRLHALETLDDQFALFTDPEFCPPQTFKDLLKTESLADDFSQLVSSYRKGNIKEIYLLLRDFSAESPGLQEALLKKRNEAWLRQLEVLLPQAPSVVAVGLAHLIGPQGLLESLESQGYSAQRWSQPSPGPGP